MMALVSRRLLLITAAILCSLSLRIECRSKSRFTNMLCESYNDSYADFKKCKLNLLGRGRVGADIYVKLSELPIDNSWINWSIYRRYNGFRPFLYNVSTDLCQLLENSNVLSFQGLVMNAIMTRSNLNHSCPYNHDIIIDNLEFSDDFLKNLPLPQGVYKIQLRFATYKVWRVQVTMFFERAE
ncbi:uncharacterized protein LOC6530087 [Drosophila yakuba]|uniref:MD-2-related lipid-recognition domain-containing protein n=1 Tax=Drosophila yakuba TaxID=7245 RepID=B4P583_DROYA|nr:uncharacterized protein LOC6530087 [Drosophila yakuba]EDW90745.1 uncharacterized protein Dyak_GE13440 [Drosophila yakuba]